MTNPQTDLLLTGAEAETVLSQWLGEEAVAKAIGMALAEGALKLERSNYGYATRKG